MPETTRGDLENERFYLVVGSDRSMDERQGHSGIVNMIRQEFTEMPGITSRIVLVVRNVNRIDQVASDLVVGDDEMDITLLL